MSHIEQTIADLEEQVNKKLDELQSLQMTVNLLCKHAGIEEKYTIAASDQKQSSFNFKGDEYFGKPLATAITEILQRHKDFGAGPTSLEDICDDLTSGGYAFENIKDPKRAVGISMSKNSKFTKLKNEKWVLQEWYPNAKPAKKVENGKNGNAGETLDDTESLEAPLNTEGDSQENPQDEQF